MQSLPAVGLCSHEDVLPSSVLLVILQWWISGAFRDVVPQKPSVDLVLLARTY